MQWIQRRDKGSLLTNDLEAGNSVVPLGISSTGDAVKDLHIFKYLLVKSAYNVQCGNRLYTIEYKRYRSLQRSKRRGESPRCLNFPAHMSMAAKYHKTFYYQPQTRVESPNGPNQHRASSLFCGQRQWYRRHNAFITPAARRDAAAAGGPSAAYEQ